MPSLWENASPEATADGLLDAARELAGGGSWENIAVGRVYYLSGRTDEGQALFDRYQAAASHAAEIGLGVNAGHDLDLHNLPLFAQIREVVEVSIGHALIKDALMMGLTATVGAYLAALKSP